MNGTTHNQDTTAEAVVSGTPTQEERDEAATAILRTEGWLEDDETADAVTYDGAYYEANSADFLILTDDEADERCADYVRETLWAFNASFLASYMPEGIDADEIDAIRGDRCENANAAMLALVAAGPYDLAELTADAIQADGRGHFLSSYNGNEIEQEVNGRTWFAYRT